MYLIFPGRFNEIDKTGFSFYLSPEMTFHQVKGTSINKVEDNKISVYPTVFHSDFNIKTGDNTSKLIRVFNANGQTVYEKTTNEANITVTGANWAEGIYLIRVGGDSINASIKVIKK